MKKDVWTGVVEVIRQSGTDPLEGNVGAFVNALAYVADRDEFQRRVTRELEKLELNVVR